MDTAEPLETQMLERWRYALHSYPYPYEMVPGAGAEAAFEGTRLQGQHEGFTPILFTPGLWRFLKRPTYLRSRESRAARASKHGAEIVALPEFTAESGKAWLADALTEAQGDDEHTVSLNEVFNGVREVNPPGDEGSLLLLKSFSESHRDRFWDEVAIMRIPAKTPAEIPAYLSWGGWNAVPRDEVILAIARHWHAAYGAEIAAISSDVLEFKVQTPPSDHAAALALFKEHYGFAPDGYDLADVPSIEKEVARLRTARYWHFWWD